MKTISKIMAMMLIALAPMTFISCLDDDDEIGLTLEGTWQGNMDIYHEYGGQNYEATWSEICFVGDPYRMDEGDGYWVDYYKDSPWNRDYVASHIIWNVDNGVIHVTFVEDNYSIYIHDYRLSDSYFIGTIWDKDQRINFRLVHVSSPNWNKYEYGWDDDWYWGNYGKAFGDVEAPKTPAPPVRHFGTPKE